VSVRKIIELAPEIKFFCRARDTYDKRCNILQNPGSDKKWKGRLVGSASGTASMPKYTISIF
jgi:hypothetical protein